jgi:hypothetical protein
MRHNQQDFSVDKFFVMSEAESDRWIKKTKKQLDEIQARNDVSKTRKTIARRLFKLALKCAQMNKRWAHDRERRAAS